MADHDHDHDHGAGFTHDGRPIQEDGGASYFEKRAKAIERILVAKGVVTAEEVRRQIEAMDTLTTEGPGRGAQIIAGAWTDPEYKQLLLSDPKTALAQIGVDYGEMNVLVVVENTPAVHNVVVCTLCSCYPRPLLGLPPDWYKSLEYRSRTVADPRGVLQEFGTDVSPDVEVRVHDSSADVRYLVVPERPPGTEGWSAERLVSLITRDSMIGVVRALAPEEAPAAV